MGGFCNIELRLAVALCRRRVQLAQEAAVKQNREKWFMISGAQE